MPQKAAPRTEAERRAYPTGLPRTADEQATFGRGLAVMGNAYASPRVLVLQHKRLPVRNGVLARRALDLGLSATPLPSYEISGWRVSGS